MPLYDETWTLREARARYFADNGFGDDGGYARKWVVLKLGPLPFAFPNTAARVRAVRYHDLHHVVTGYGTDLVGEAEISAWEIASGCAGFVAAWILNLYAWTLGLLAGAPRALWRAFVRGRRSRNLYRFDYGDALLDTQLGALRARLGLGGAPGADRFEATAGERIAFAAWSAISATLLLATLALLALPFLLLGRALL